MNTRTETVIIGRLCLVIITVGLLLMALCAIGVPFQIEPYPKAVAWSAWIGAGFWVLLVGASWYDLFTNQTDTSITTRLIFGFVVSGIASLTIAGMWMPGFARLSQWANALILVLACLAILSSFRGAWRNCANTKT